MNRGYSLLELVVAAGLLTVVLAIAASTILAGGGETRLFVQRAELTRQVGQARDRIGLLLRFAEADSSTLQLGQLGFRKTLLNPESGARGLSNRQVLGFAYTSDDPDNGRDDDGDGLIDEGSLFHVGDDGVLHPFLANVLEGSFQVELPSEAQPLLRVRFQVAARVRPGAGTLRPPPDADGIYAAQAGFLVLGGEERIRVRN